MPALHGSRRSQNTSDWWWPLVRRNIMQLIRNIGAEVKSGQLDELITCGSQLGRMAEDRSRPASAG